MPLTSHDQLSKSLIKLFFTDFLHLIDPESSPRLRAGEATFLDKEDFTDWPAGDRREMDLLAKVPVERKERPLRALGLSGCQAEDGWPGPSRSPGHSPRSCVPESGAGRS